MNNLRRPQCGLSHIKRNGYTHYGKQNYRCEDCDRQFVEDSQRIGEEVKDLIKVLLAEPQFRSFFPKNWIRYRGNYTMEDPSKAVTNLSPERRDLLELQLGRLTGKTAPEEKPLRDSTAQTSAEGSKCAVRSAPADALQTPAEEKRVSAINDSQMQFSLFYFASNELQSNNEDKYRLVIEGAKFADQHGFTAVWTPERHFNPFGGLYPNPSVMSASPARCILTWSWMRSIRRCGLAPEPGA